jgi:hypothetical protein
LDDVTTRDLYAQFDLAIKIRDCESEANESIITYKKLSLEIDNRLSKSSNKNLHKSANLFIAELTEVAENLYQLKNQSPKDKLANPIKLNDRLTGLRSHLEAGDMKPTRSYYEVYNDLSAELEFQTDKFSDIINKNLPKLNKELNRLKLQTREL